MKQGKCFLFHLESSFRSWDEQILTFQIFKCLMTLLHAWVWNPKHVLLNKLGNKHSGNEIWPVYVILENKKLLSKKYMRNVVLKLVPTPVIFSKNPLHIGLWRGQHADLDKSQKLCYYISNISSLLQKLNFPIEIVLNSLQTQKVRQLVFRLQFL